MGRCLAIIIMGVSGAGKSTVGELLAAALCCPFYDADSYHSEENKEKMRSGVPLTDEDRMPWLTRLRDLLVDQLLKGTCVVLACSALCPKYRDILRSAGSQFTSHRLKNGMYNNLTTTVQAGDSSCSPIVFVHLKATAQLLATHLMAREKTGTHFMPAVLLQSQIDSLEIGSSETDILETDASLAPATIVLNIQAQLPI
ncbi:unnamed protein product [Sphagnum compactum]